MSDREIGDDEEENPALQGAQKLSEKKRVENAKFKTWFGQQAEILCKEDEQAKLRPEYEQQLTLKGILAKQESNVIITNPRDYQMELYEKAKTQNTIAVLDTGSGKTLIAVLLLRHMIDQELEDRAAGKPKRISFFLVDKVTLVFQQAGVLRANLDQNIETFCGHMRNDLWSAEMWENHISENMIIVCTAEVLVQSLSHAFITIDRINLLIFDEAHHAKKGHPYAKIIKDFYLEEKKPSKRPRIFGMTASPVDAEDNVFDKARELESLLHSKIATATDLTLLQATVSKPQEIVLTYERLRPTVTYGRVLPGGIASGTRLHHHLKTKYHNLAHFDRLLQHSQDIVSELGTWCSDIYWTFAFAERQAKAMEMKAEKRHYARKKTAVIEDLDAEISKIREALEYISTYEFGEPQLKDPDLSAKVITLHNLLQQHFERPSDVKCLVFVDKRYTARILDSLFTLIGGKHLRSSVLIGAHSFTVDGLQSSFREQALTVMRFRSGQFNCLFATSVAEEGIDIQDCNLVIRFDPCKTMIQYVQSRGRARHRNSKFVHFVEDGNSQQKQKLDDIRRFETEMRQFCASLPADRLLQGHHEEPGLENVYRREKDYRSYVVPSTGAKLTYDFSLCVLAHFVSCLPFDTGDDTNLHYVMSVRAGHFVCEVVLPEKSPIRSAVGRPATTKHTAKRSAAFEACFQLRKGRYLDAWLMPIYVKQLPAMRNAHLAIHDRRSSQYDMQLKPSLWEQGHGTIPSQLFLTAISLAEAWDRPASPIGILTRSRLPSFPQFPLYRLNGQTTNVLTLSLSHVIPISANQRDHLTQFTLRIFKDIFNKTFRREDEHMSYWLAPLVEFPVDTLLNTKAPSELVDWKLLQEQQPHDAYKWNELTPNEFLSDKFLIDIWHGGKRYFTQAVDSSMTPIDLIPETAANYNGKDTILEGTVSLFKNSKTKRVWNLHQPVIETDRTLHRLNVLADPTETEKSARTKCFVCPEPLDISLVGRTARMAIIHRLESYLIALEACATLQITVEPALALEAITKDCDDGDESQGERLNFQRGMGPNYERLEFIGDCFLKMATTIALYITKAGSDEYAMHVDRMMMICNQNLFNHFVESKFYEYIRGQTFSRRTWYPQGMQLLHGRGKNDDKTKSPKQPLSKKTIADVAEALIGAALVSHVDSGYCSLDKFDDAVLCVTTFVRNPYHTMIRWSDYYESYTKPSYQIEKASASQLDLAARIVSEHDYKFKYPRLLRSAFNHPSQPTMFEELPSYQRLEFLGDSLLDMTAVFFLFNNFPEKDPQWLTEHKMPMVSNKFLGALCVKLGFHRHLRHNAPSISGQIQDFIRELEEARTQADGSRDYWMFVKQPPKCVSDIVESYLGAVFVDSNFNYAEVQRFFDDHIKWFFEDMSLYDTFASNHPTTKLYSRLSEDMGCYNYRLQSSDIKSVDGSPSKILAGFMIHGEVVAHGQAESSKNAKMAASKMALSLIQGLAPYEYRQKFKCDCREDRADVVRDGQCDHFGTAV